MSDANRKGEVTILLENLLRADADPEQATERLSILLYRELERLASSYLRKDRPNHTLETNALVHEAYIRLAEGAPAQWLGRAHFMGIAARVMRQILVDHARKRGAAKRGGQWRQVTLDSRIIGRDDDFELELIALDGALAKLSGEDERSARVAELRIFADMSIGEIAELIGVSARTVDNDWALARMYIARELSA